jgi:hypothetical protein
VRKTSKDKKVEMPDRLHKLIKEARDKINQERMNRYLWKRLDGEPVADPHSDWSLTEVD